MVIYVYYNNNWLVAHIQDLNNLSSLHLLHICVTGDSKTVFIDFVKRSPVTHLCHVQFQLKH